MDLLRTGLPIGVTGAGVSVWAGYPCWPDLITRLAQEVRRRTRDEVDTDRVIQNNTDLLHCAQRLGTYLGPDFARFIRAEFGDNNLALHDVLFKLVSLPLKHFLTLNFETSCERAHPAVGRTMRSVLLTLCCLPAQQAM